MLRLRSDGKLELSSSSNRDSVIFSKATIRKSRWMHLALVHYPSRSSNPSIRMFFVWWTIAVYLSCLGLFVDGVIQDGINWAYPRPDSKPQVLTYTIGNGIAGKSPSWCISSAYLIATPIRERQLLFRARICVITEVCSRRCNPIHSPSWTTIRRKFPRLGALQVFDI